MSDPETTITADDTREDEDSYEQESLQRAAVIERYNQLREQHLQTPTETTTESDTEPTDGGRIRRICRELISPTTISKSIIDIETRPQFDLETPADAWDIEPDMVRFVFADGQKSRWYTFGPETILGRIVEFYGDGDFGRLFKPGITVDVVENACRSRHIMHPVPYDTHTGHLRYPMRRRRRAVEKLECVDSSNSMWTHEHTTAMILSGVSFWLITGGILLLPVWWMVSTTAMSVDTAMFGLMAIWSAGVLIHLVVGGLYEAASRSYTFQDHYRLVAAPLQRIATLIRRGIRRANQRNGL